MKKIYEKSSLEKCLKSACDDLCICKEEVNYKILEEKRHMFRKRVVIEVQVDDENDNKDKCKIEKDENCEETFKLDEKEGTVKIVEGKIIVKNPKEDGVPASILVGNEIKVLVDGEEVKGKKEIFEENKIEAIFDESKAHRELKIDISEDCMEAYANIEYKPEKIYMLKDSEESKSLFLRTDVIKEINPPKYNIEELKQQLTTNNVVYGIIEENLKECVENNCKKLLVAKGQAVIDGEDDSIEIKFQTDTDLKKLKEDKVGNIDFKSIGSIEAVHRDDLIAVRHIGQEGKDGIDITGKRKKSKPGKRLKLKSGDGCIAKDENTLVAAIDGKPCVKGNAFYVYQIHEIRSDVDLKTGNIKFAGDITIYGSVKEGMEVECGNSLNVEKDLERSKVSAKGNVNIKGNVIATKISAGGQNVEKLKFIEDLKKLKETLEGLVAAVEEIKRYDLLGAGKKDGQIIKILIENKFKVLPKLCISVISDLNMEKNDFNEGNLAKLIKSKLLGISPINIEHHSVLYKIIEEIDEKISILSVALSLPVNVKISYSQDSYIESSGDVLIYGKGEYISKITANGNIYFIQQKSVARGGVLKAKDEIKCRVVGSIAGVSTTLKVEKQGHIWVDEAYQNTVFSVGNREYILDVPSKDVHAYLDSRGDIVIDRLKL